MQRPPFSVQLFAPAEIQRIANYITNTYFRHYKLYKYAFTPAVCSIDMFSHYNKIFIYIDLMKW